MLTLHVYYSNRGQWFADLPGAQGAGLTAWDAIAEALAVWERRGRPTVDGPGPHRGGADWVVDLVWDRGPGHLYRYHVEGTNLGCAPGTYGRRFTWDTESIDDPRYEILPGAWERGTEARAARAAWDARQLAGVLA